MPRPRTAAVRLGNITIHEDTSEDNDETMASDVENTEEESASVGESMSQDEQSSEEEEVEETVAEDMCRFLSSFEGLQDKYRLINRIGEGMSDILTVVDHH
jgi:cell division control protein 7